VVEVQLSKDAQKKRTWPRYLTAVGAQLGCLANVLVVTPDEQVHRWAAEPIEVGLGNNVITPFVLGPADVPRVDRTTALDRPELAVLSALAHGTERDGEWVARIALAAVASLDEDRCAAYTDFVLNAVSAGVRAELEREMREANYFEATGLVHDLIEKGRALGVADGREEGREEGRRRGQAEALLAVLSARGLSLTENERARVLAERDERTLARWLVAAATARRITDVLD
jgi:hypothetical protein